MDFGQLIVTAPTPAGKLRASINLGNMILASRVPPQGDPFGVSVHLTRAFTEHLAVELELAVFDAAGKSVEAISNERADIGFLAVDVLRAQAIAFTAPYLLIEGFDLVRDSSSITAKRDVDQPDNRVVEGKGSAYELFLSWALEAAQTVHEPTSPTVVQTFVGQELEIAAGVNNDLRPMPADCQAYGFATSGSWSSSKRSARQRTRGPAAPAVLHQFLEEMKESGFVSTSLARHEIAGASVAPFA
ncbi:polar amino acid transport system substrate-binding protein [Paraburkholderia strydomiana]|nr:polar amino acid transport system substrate-binding protein [Paraburkholderia strydomiana]